MLTVTDVSYALPTGRTLFRDVNLQLAAGEVAVIEGPSGCGKSTLLALVGGLLSPTTGSVATQTEAPHPWAWVLQSLNSLGARTVLDNAALLATLDGVNPLRARVAAAAALERLGLADRADDRARQLSGGELQRLAVARALTSSRPLLLVDEPTSQLDRTNAGVVMSALVEHAATGAAVLIVTHDRVAVPPTCPIFALHEAGLERGR